MFIFWLGTLLLLACAFGFIYPWLRSTPLFSWVVFLVISFVAYTLYFNLGKSRYLPGYYSPEAKALRLRQAELRQLLTEFKKEEFRLKLRLEADPSDSDAEWRLLDILAIKALQNGEKAQALDYWQKALIKMPEPLKAQYEDIISQLKAKNKLENK